MNKMTENNARHQIINYFVFIYKELTLVKLSPSHLPVYNLEVNFSHNYNISSRNVE